MDKIIIKVSQKQNLLAHPLQIRTPIFGYKFPKRDLVELAPISLNMYAESTEVASRSSLALVNQH